MKHERRVVGHVSGWQEQMATCVCGQPWPCQIPSKQVCILADHIHRREYVDAKSCPFCEVEKREASWKAVSDEQDRQIDRLRAALAALSRRHEGWQRGMGPCVCAEHEAARKLLAGVAAVEPSNAPAEDALVKYGRHTPSCATQPHWNHHPLRECDCGLSDALRATVNGSPQSKRGK
jgi:hypothetical protein